MAMLFFIALQGGPTSCSSTLNLECLS